jgi:hypothetical protein
MNQVFHHALVSKIAPRHDRARELNMTKIVLISASLFMVNLFAPEISRASSPACVLEAERKPSVAQLEPQFRQHFCQLEAKEKCDARWANFSMLASRALRDPKITDEGTLAYIFATAWGETSILDFAPGQERIDNNISTRAYSKPVGGKVYKGRGWVQLTGIDKYREVGKFLQRDLVGDPNLVSDPDIAYTIIARGLAGGWFETYRSNPGGGHTSAPIKLGDFLTPQNYDFDGARAVINANCPKKSKRKNTCAYPDVAVGGGHFLPAVDHIDRAREIGARARIFEQMICHPS